MVRGFNEAPAKGGGESADGRDGDAARNRFNEAPAKGGGE